MQGCIELLKRYNVPMDGRRAVVLGRSNIVGIPVSQLLLQVRPRRRRYGGLSLFGWSVLEFEFLTCQPPRPPSRPISLFRRRTPP